MNVIILQVLKMNKDTLKQKKELKQKCEDCNVNLIHLKEMDKSFKRYINKNFNGIPKIRLKEINEHKTIYCPKCYTIYDKDFKKTKLKIGFLKK